MVVDTISWKFNWVSITCNFYKSCMHSHVICICTRVAAAAEEVVYEVVAEPPEPQGQAPQEEVRGESAQGPANPKASPGACPIILNYDSLCMCFIYYLCIMY